MKSVGDEKTQIKKRTDIRPRRGRFTLPLVAIALITIALATGSSLWKSGNDSGMAPDFTVVIFNGDEQWMGKEITLSSLRGKSIAIHFSASWCAVCSYIFESLEPFREKGLFVMGIGVLDKETNFRGMIYEMNMDTPVAFDLDGIARKYDVSILPTTVFITKDGKIYKRVLGTFDKEQLEEIVKGLLKA